MKILFIRHGETTGDIEDRYGGAYDDHLTEKGKEQMRTTAQALKGRPIERIFSSTLIRAQEATEIINEVLHTEIELMDGLRERDYGVLGGLTKAEALEKYPEAVELHKNPANTDPSGEPQADFLERIRTTFNELASRDYDMIAIVSHGGFIRNICTDLGVTPPDRIGDGGVVEVQLAPEDEGWKAYYVEVAWPQEGPMPYSFMTEIAVVPNTFPDWESIAKARAEEDAAGEAEEGGAKSSS